MHTLITLRYSDGGVIASPPAPQPSHVGPFGSISGASRPAVPATRLLRVVDDIKINDCPGGIGGPPRCCELSKPTLDHWSIITVTASFSMILIERLSRA